jgi:hypothetical protein
MAKKSTTRSPPPTERQGNSLLARPRSGEKAIPGPKRAKADPKLQTRPDAALAIRRLRRQLAEAMATIEELQVCADTDFLLGVLNRRGFERELSRAIAYIGRYQATGALIVLDVDRLKPIKSGEGPGSMKCLGQAGSSRGFTNPGTKTISGA